MNIGFYAIDIQSDNPDDHKKIECLNCLVKSTPFLDHGS